MGSEVGSLAAAIESAIDPRLGGRKSASKQQRGLLRPSGLLQRSCLKLGEYSALQTFVHASFG